MKNIRGITLISLVITIVVLVILSAVAISLTLGNNGILNEAKLAKQEYLNAQSAEGEKINDLYSEMLIATNDSSKITISIEDLNRLIDERIEEKHKNMPIQKSLWVGNASDGEEIELSESYENFDVLYFYQDYSANDCYSIFSVLTAAISDYDAYSRGILMTTYDTSFLTIKFNSTIKLKITSMSTGKNNSKLTRITGVKY